MTTEQKVINWAEIELAKLFKEIPGVVKQYGNESLQVCNAVKAALASPAAATIEAALAQMIPGAGVWEPAVIAAIEKAIGQTIPLITKVEANAATDESLDAQALGLVQYLQTLSPFMQRAGLLKLLSGIFMSLDPSLSEVAADTAAQTAYAVSVHRA